MRITESSVKMSSSRNFISVGSRTERKEEKSFFETAGNLLHTGKEGNNRDSYGHDRYRRTLSDSFYPMTYGRINGLRSKDMMQSAADFQYNILAIFLGRLLRISNFGSRSVQTVTYEEHENTEFHADGIAKTDDGRTIDFNVDLFMSRSCMEYINIESPLIQDALMDPLIINVGSGITDIRDQKFTFDLDADGTEEEISMPGRGSGFLALDLNNDGVINDGSELFGTKSGDGFKDLRKYDSDGNGWIDENDAVFNRLKVWCKGDRGEDILMNLKEADVGAIFLGSANTEFTLDSAFGGRNGVLRSTGIFLKESAGVGTIQHVDLAARKI